MNSQQPRRPTRLAANVYLVLGISVLIVSASPKVSTPQRYAIGIAVEVGLVALMLVFARLERLPIGETLRLRRPETRVLLLALATVPGLWIAGVTLNLLSSLVLGYTTSVAPAQYPADAWQALLLAVTTVFVAPACEELMFRGYIQRAYEAPRPWLGAVVGGVLFAAYHLRFQGFLGLVPVSLALGLIAWRTGSIVPAMVVHAGFNAIATLLLVSASFLSTRGVGTVGAMLLCAAALAAPVSVLALWMLWRASEPDEALDRTSSRHSVILRWGWIVPALVLVGVFSYAGMSEVVLNRHPERVLDNRLVLSTAPTWLGTETWRYSIRDRLGREHGEAICTRTGARSPAEVVLTCEAHHTGFDLVEELPRPFRDLDFQPKQLPSGLTDLLSSARAAEPTTWSLTARWSQPDLHLSDLSLHEIQGTQEYQLVHAEPLPAPAGEETFGTEAPLSSSGSSGYHLALREWAWRSSGLAFELPYGTHVAMVVWNQNGESGVTSAFLHVRGGEPVWTPAGNYVTWRVDLTWGDESGRVRKESAWYCTEPPHTLVRYDDGSVSYVLAKIQVDGPQPVK